MSMMKDYSAIARFWKTPAAMLAALALVVGAAAPSAHAKTPSSDEAVIKQLVDEVAALKKQVNAQEGESAGRRLAFMYAYFMDNGLYDQVQTLFADKMDNCEVSGYGRYNGRKGCVLVWDKVVGQPPIRDKDGHIPFGRYSRHQLMKDIVHVNDDGVTADGRFDYMGFGGELGKVDPTGFQVGVYRMGFVKERGVWKIARFSLVFDNMNYADANWALSPTMRCPREGLPPADGPYSYFHPFPEIGVVPFETPNPVTGKPIEGYVNPTHYWQGNWPGEYGGPCGKRPDAPTGAEGTPRN